MKILKYIPLFFFVLLLYNIVAFSMGNKLHTDPFVMMDFQLLSGANFEFTINDFFVIIGLIILYIEIFKATRTSEVSIVDHVLSLCVFIIFLIEFITVSAVGNSTFLILSMLSLLDVVAGFTITISTARRDLSVEH